MHLVGTRQQKIRDLPEFMFDGLGRVLCILPSLAGLLVLATLPHVYFDSDTCLTSAGALLPVQVHCSNWNLRCHRSLLPVKFR